MVKRPHKKAALLALLLLAAPVHAVEMSPALRESERLYQSGRFEEAALKAREFKRFFPDDFQNLLILGMSDFHAGNYLEASDIFRLAARKNPRHPIVVRYSELLREIEYRSGPFSLDPDRQDQSDKMVTAEYFKRGFFGPSFTHTSEAADSGLPPTPLDPVLIKKPLATESFNADYPVSQLALPAPHPYMESILTAESMAEMAERAFEKGEFQKSYLFFSQLTASAPHNRRFLIGKSEAAFHMKRYRQVLEILGPMVAAGSIESFSEQQRQKIKHLMEQSRKNVFSAKGR
ncbi:MAG: hypothetical protein PHD82_00690 [Candidatus Riflebacteria bacterium]|nr:hypothetical protein [Candidatus Riflebacteria bacterium]